MGAEAAIHAGRRVLLDAWHSGTSAIGGSECAGLAPSTTPTRQTRARFRVHRDIDQSDVKPASAAQLGALSCRARCTRAMRKLNCSPSVRAPQLPLREKRRQHRLARMPRRSSQSFGNRGSQHRLSGHDSAPSTALTGGSRYRQGRACSQDEDDLCCTDRAQLLHDER